MADLVDRVSDLQLNGPDMMVDDYEQYNNDRQEVVNISPDDPSEDPEPEIRADDCMSPFLLLQPPASQLGGTPRPPAPSWQRR